jgi:dihydroorotate dehydrogenase electron transfer subunit
MTHYADCARVAQLEILEHRLLAQQTKCVRLAAPAELCAALPGQFFMLRDLRGTDPLIGRAFALYDSDPRAGWIEIAYLVKGKFTSSIANLRAGDHLGVWGPLGNSFDDSPVQHLIMVAGGIGQTPFVCLAKEASGKQQFGSRRTAYANKVSLCYGVRSSSYLAGLESFQQAGAEVLVATEDGSIGPAQRVTALLEGLLSQETDPSQVRVVCCGPEPMMEACSQIAKTAGVRCEVSLETPMACGIGICFTCVAKLGTVDDWDYQRTCVEGPIFDSSRVLWH